MATAIRRRVMGSRTERPSGTTKSLWAAEGSPRLLRLEGVSLALSGVLFSIKALFDAKVGEPPTAATELIAWRSAEKVLPCHDQ